MKKVFAFFLLALAGAGAWADVTGIAQLPLLNLNGTGNVKPNLMLLYDNSGSMAYTFTPDYIDDSSTCRSRARMVTTIDRRNYITTTGCKIGHPPFNSADFNRQYYDPKVRYAPPVKYDGTSYASMTRGETTDWTSVPTDGFNVNKTDLLGQSNTRSNLATGFPDLRWCDTDGRNCVYNTATYSYPSDDRYTSDVIAANPYYYTINVAEYCTDTSLTKCTSTAVGAPAPAGYPEPAKVRWCDAADLNNCQAKFVGNFKYPRFGNPNGGFVGAYGTITINASASSNAMTIAGVTVTEPGGAVTITNGAVSAPNGTNTLSRQTALAVALATSIINKSGLANQYLACVKTASGSVPGCATYGITLATENVVAVIPIDCAAGTSGKSIGVCSLVADQSRSGWAVTVNATAVQTQAAQPATALITVNGTAANTSTNSKKTTLRSGTKLGGVTIIATDLVFGKKAGNGEIADAIRAAISARGIAAYLGGNGISDACKAAASNVVCVVDTNATVGNAAITMGQLDNPSSVTFGTTPAKAPVTAAYDAVPTVATPLGSGAAVFVRTDIVATVNSYPKGTGRTDCAGATCTYDEEMTNFANWYTYYKSRNQMMKTAVGQAFQALNSNYNVGIVSLSTAAAEGSMTPPREFSGNNRSAWYTSLYAMNGNQSTPIRQALHAIGKMYGNQSPYVATAGNEVVQYACQQNFTFVTTDGYWNGGAAATVTNNDNVENAARFCTRAKGCVDPSAQSYNSLADVALYWYNGGSNNGTSSLRSDLEDWTADGLVRGAAGDNKRLHMNTYTLGLGVDGIMTYASDYDTAPSGDFYKLITGVQTGCPWNNNGAYVWPDPKTGESSGSAAYQSRVDDLWHTAINGHGKYFSASDPKQVVAGLSEALSAIETRTGSASAAATSTPNITMQDNDVFSSTFTTVKWYGEMVDRKISTADGTVAGDAVWSTVKTMQSSVGASSDTRTIWMLDTATKALKSFAYGSMTATEQGWFNNKCSYLAQCPTLSTANRTVVNNGANIVNWLRGQQQYADDSILRAYSRYMPDEKKPTETYLVVLGDIASSKPAYLRDPRKGYTLSGYAQYKADKSTRAATIFVGANDGMVHAFSAASGSEVWAYAPRITMKKLYLQASTTYGTNHQYTVDGAPEVADVQIDGAWRSVLVGGLNAGGRGYYALDVTDPANPRALWELCADAAVCSGVNYDADIGLTFGNPQFGTWRDAGGVSHWVVFLTSGYNNVPGTDSVNNGDGKGYLYVVDIATGRVLSKASTGVGSVDTPSGLARITAITANPQTDPLVTYVYGGDNQGKMWRFDFTAAGNPAVLQMGDAGATQPVTSRPEVTQCRVDGRDADGNVTTRVDRIVTFGTGRLLDVPDISDIANQSVYVLKDSGVGISPANWRNATSMTRRALSKVSSGAGDTYTMDDTPVDLSTHAGWYFDLDRNKGERVNLDPKVVAGTLDVVTNLPSTSSACTVGGKSNVYLLDACTGTPLQADGVVGATLSSNSAAVGSLVVQLPGGTFVQISTLADGELVPTKFPPADSTGARKAGWRRVRD